MQLGKEFFLKYLTVGKPAAAEWLQSNPAGTYVAQIVKTHRVSDTDVEVQSFKKHYYYYYYYYYYILKVGQFSQFIVIA